MVLPERTPKLLGLEDYLLLAAVLLLPWAFGGIDLSAYRMASLLLIGAACAAVWKRGWRGWGLGWGESWLLPTFLLVGWAACQIVPLPPAAVRVLSPEEWRRAKEEYERAAEAHMKKCKYQKHNLYQRFNDLGRRQSVNRRLPATEVVEALI